MSGMSENQADNNHAGMPNPAVRTPVRILFISNNNAGRCLMAESMMKQMVKRADQENVFYIRAASANTGSGEQMFVDTRRKLIDMRVSYNKSSRKLKAADYDKYDYLIGMDEDNIDAIRYIIKEDPDNKIRKLLSFCTDESQEMDVDDPWFSRDLDQTVKDIQKGLYALMDTVIRERGLLGEEPSLTQASEIENPENSENPENPENPEIMGTAEKTEEKKKTGRQKRADKTGKSIKSGKTKQAERMDQALAAEETVKGEAAALEKTGEASKRSRKAGRSLKASQAEQADRAEKAETAADTVGPRKNEKSVRSRKAMPERSEKTQEEEKATRRTRQLIKSWATVESPEQEKKPADTDTLAGRLKRSMKEMGLTQVELYKLCVPRFRGRIRFGASSLSNYMRGTQKPTFDKVKLLADVMGKDPWWLWNGEMKSVPDPGLESGLTSEMGAQRKDAEHAPAFSEEPSELEISQVQKTVEEKAEGEKSSSQAGSLQERIQQVMLEKKINGKELFVLCKNYFGDTDFSYRSLSYYIRGESVPSPDRAEILAKALGVDSDWLIYGTETEEKSPKKAEKRAGKKTEKNPDQKPEKNPDQKHDQKSGTGAQKRGRAAAEREKEPSARRKKSTVGRAENQATGKLLIQSERGTVSQTQVEVKPEVQEEDTVFIQYAGWELDISGIEDACVNAWKARYGGGETPAREIALYIKPEDRKTYWVVNHSDHGELDLS